MNKIIKLKHCFYLWAVLLSFMIGASVSAETRTELIRAGQDIVIGQVSVWNDENTLYVKYDTEGSDWWLGMTHVNVSEGAIVVDANGQTLIDPSDIRPAPGHYTIQTPHDPMVQSYLYEFDLAEYGWMIGDDIYVLTHAEALRVDTNGDVVQEETAFGGDNGNTGSGWWYYTVFTLSGSSGPENPDSVYNISGSVFFDENKDGLNNNEVGIGGITVLLIEDGNTIATTVSDEFGNYSFEGVYPGEYTVQVDPEGQLLGLSSVTGTSKSVTVTNSDLEEVDFGYELPAVSGTVFYDITGDGVLGTDEPGIEGIVVMLYDADGNVVASAVTDENGFFEFDVYPGDYTVGVEDISGMTATTPVLSNVSVGFADEGVDFGFSLDLSFFCGQVANGYTIGFWKNNIKKAIDGKRKGFQIGAETLKDYVGMLSDFALSPLNVTTLQEAYDILSATGSDELLLLSKQLMGAEFNFANQAYIGGDVLFTRLFLYYGEYILAHPDEFSPAEILHAKDWYDAYNNSHGDVIYGPDCL